MKITYHVDGFVYWARYAVRINTLRANDDFLHQAKVSSMSSRAISKHLRCFLGAIFGLSGIVIGSRAVRSTPVSTAAQLPAVYAQITSTDLALGVNRFTFGIIDHNHPLKGGTPQVSFYYLNGASAAFVERIPARFNNFARGLKDTDANSAAVELGGVYVAYPRFAHAGKWGAVIRLRYHGKSYDLTPGFAVTTHSLTPAVGSPAPRSRNPTVKQERATLLDSGRPPDDMHRLSIAQAIAQHKPLLVLFATAAFCTSRMCGPEIGAVERLESRYRSRVNFVHIEIYDKANPRYGYAPTVLQWHLRTEPWVFVIDRHGIIRAKFEGPTPASEIEPVLRRLLR